MKEISQFLLSIALLGCVAFETGTAQKAQPNSAPNTQSPQVPQSTAPQPDIAPYTGTEHQQVNSPQQLAVQSEIKAQQLDAAAANIVHRQPDVEVATLSHDRRVIATTYPRIEQHLTENGFTTSEAQAITLLSWKAIRTYSPLNAKLDHNRPFTGDAFSQFATTSFGGIDISSTPSKANIFLDETELKDITNTRFLTSARRHVIKLVKQGYEDESGQVEVTPGGIVTFVRTLKKKREK